MKTHRTLLAAMLGLLIAGSEGASGAIVNVPAEQPTVQQGVDAASPGDTVLIAPGEYVENIVIQKDLTLQGAGFDATSLRSTAASEVTVSVFGASLTLRELRLEGLALNQFFTKRALHAEQSTLTLRNVHIKRYTFSHLYILDGHLDIEDVSIGPCDEDGAPFPCGGATTASDLGLRIIHSTFVIRRLRGGHLPPGTNVAGGTDHLVDISGSSSGIIEGCVLVGNGATNSNAIRLHDGSVPVQDPDIPGPFAPVPGQPTALIRDNVLVGAGNAGIPRGFTEGGIALGGDSFAEIHGNTISGFAAGLYVYNNASAAVHDNRITRNHRDGVVTNIGTAPGYNGAVPDLGGGAYQSPGGNSICENGQYALYQRSTVAVSAENNTWGSSQAAVIDQAIHDDDEDPSLGAVSFQPLHPQSAECDVFSTFVSRPLFEQAAGELTLIDFDTEPFGQPVAAPGSGVLVDDLYSVLGVDFSAGVIFDESGSPSPGSSPPNTLSNSQVNTPTPALADARFQDPVSAVGLTNVGAVATLRIFDEADNLIASLDSDAVTTAGDFIGFVSGTPIRRFEFDFVAGLGFAGDDLVFTRIRTLTPAGTQVSVQPVDTTTGTAPVTLTFTEVDVGGSTALTTSPHGPAGPSSFQVCNPPLYLDLTTTAGTAPGSSIEVCIEYGGFSCNPNTIQLLHFEDTDADGLEDSWVDVTTSNDTVNQIVCGVVDSLSLFGVFQPTTFVRGDSNADGRIDIADAVYVLQWLFQGGPEPPCLEAADVDDVPTMTPGHDSDVSDAIYVLQYLLLGGPRPPGPFPACGSDPGGGGCVSYPHCP